MSIIGPMGLRIWNENGEPRLDTSDRLIRYHSSYNGVLAIDTQTTITVTGLVPDSDEWKLIYETVQGAGGAWFNITIGVGQFTVQNTLQDNYYGIQNIPNYGMWYVTIYRY